MKNSICIFLFLFISTIASAQKSRNISVAFQNVGSAYPFSQFGKLVSEIEHPGVEAGYSFNWKSKNKHVWFQEVKLGYFYHRFVQHAFPFYTDIGYRYQFQKKWSARVAIGAGYLHSIPATGKFKLNENGEYKNDKGIGRSQALAVLNFGTAYTAHPTGERPVKVFATYQQLIQMPFIKQYVPLLPYNAMLIGVSLPLKK